MKAHSFQNKEDKLLTDRFYETIISPFGSGL